MEIVTLRIEENTLGALDDEKSQHGFSNRTEYIRFLIENRDVIVSNTLAVDDDVQERLDELEQRVDDLESSDEQDPRASLPEDPSDIEMAVDDEPHFELRLDDDPRDHDRADQGGDPTRQEMLDVLDDLDVPGRKTATEYARREAIQYAWDRLREEQTMASSELANDVFGQFFKNEDLGYKTSSRYPGYGLWDNCVRDALKELPGVEDPGRRGNEWRFQPKT